MTTRTSYSQFTIMVDFMEKYGDLSKPTSGPHGRQWAKRKWKELTVILNSEGIGESRSEDKWRKVWSNLKNNTKRKWAKFNRSVQGTGGGPASKMCMTYLENRVMALIGIQAAVGMPIAEIGFGQEDSSLRDLLTSTKNFIIQPSVIGDEDWNTPGSSHDIDPRVSPIMTPRLTSTPKINIPLLSTSPPKSTTPPRSTSTLNSTSPPRSTSSSRTTSPSRSASQPRTTSPNRSKSPFVIQSCTQPTPQPLKKNKRLNLTLEDYFIRCEKNARDDNRERDRMFMEIERERMRQREIELRQRDVELELRAQWVEILKVGMEVLQKYLNEKGRL